MRAAVITMLLSLVALQGNAANAIDSLQTTADICDFILHRITYSGIYSKDFIIHLEPGIVSGAAPDSKFYKLDLERNGKTDLLVDSKMLFAIIDQGNDKYEFHCIDRDFHSQRKYEFAGFDTVHIPVFIILNAVLPQQRSIEKPKTPDTLIYKFGDFIEYNPHPENYQIQEIFFSAPGCFGTCPNFELCINADRSATYNAKSYNQAKGLFKTKIESSTFDSIIAILDYLDFPLLYDRYSTGWIDIPIVRISIMYHNGQEKRIADDGLVGTFGLIRLYKILFDLRDTQKWLPN